MTMNIINLLIILFALFASTNSYSGGEKPTGQMPRGGNENNIGVYSNSQGGEGGRGGLGGNVSDGAIRNNVTGIAAGGVTAQGGGSESTLSVNGRGIGNTNINYPRQTPMAYAPTIIATQCSPYSYSGGFGHSEVSVSFGMNSRNDDCVRDMDTVRWQSLGQPVVACNRMIVGDGSEENQEALKNSGIACASVTGVYVPLVAKGIVPSQTPTLDYVTRPELNQKLDNAQRLGVLK